MATYYVGSGGDNANDGTTWAKRKLTLNGAEDIPVSAGDTVYVGPGTYRELLTCDVSGSAGSPISYIGDYTGVNTDGVGGVVRITGSDNDTTGARNNCIVASGKSYRTFEGFTFDLSAQNQIVFTGTYTNLTITKCYFQFPISGANFYSDADCTTLVFSNCYFTNRHNATCIQFYSSSDKSDRAISIESCIFFGGKYALYVDNIGGITIKNSIIARMGNWAVRINSLAAGQVCTINNCIIGLSYSGLSASAVGEIVEDYNLFWGNEASDRSNVSVGANSLAYPPLFDTRWFFELVNNTAGPNSPTQVISPFDLASYSQLIDVAGTSPTTTDMRGTSAINSVREWGVLEYDSTLKTEGAVVNPPGWL